MILKLIRSILTIKECQGPFKAVLDESRGQVACPARFERATYALGNKKPPEGGSLLGI
jgi:hypothetical protein